MVAHRDIWPGDVPCQSAFGILRRSRCLVVACVVLCLGWSGCARRPDSGFQAGAAGIELSEAGAVLADGSRADADSGAEGETSAAADDAGETADASWDGDPEYAFLPPRTVQQNGPHKIAATALQTWVHLYPDDETPYLGYLRAGTMVDRSESWIAKTVRCRDGWYEVLPRGYVCDGNRATLDLDDPVVVASWKRARRGEPLPYAYVRPSGVKTYLYFKLPSKEDQRRIEGDTLRERATALNPALIPNVELVGEPEPVPPFLDSGAPLPNPYGATQRLRYSVHEGRAAEKSAFALLSVHAHEGRLFGLTTDLDLVAIDRTDIVKPTTRHGAEVSGLPAGIVRTHNTPRFRMDAIGTPVRDGTFERAQVVSLSGTTKGDLWETRDGFWIAAATMDRIEPRISFPSFATGERKWIDVSIKGQFLVAYVGTGAVYVAQVSTGLGEMADPEKSFATVRGTFTIKSKHVTATMTGTRQADDYELADVPYVQYFHEGYALHGTFWHDNFGRVQSHGCVNLTPTDAAWLFEFTDPPVPPEWHGAMATSDSPGTIVYVRY